MTPSTMKAASTGADLYVGTAGWSYDDWKGIVYPVSPPKGFRGLRFLAQYFNTVELNNTFYRPPNPRYCQGWLRDVSDKPDFSFTAKLWQRFTHQREQPWTAQEVAVFRDGIAPLREVGKLGALLVQFPWSFRYGEPSRDWLSRVVAEFADMPLVLEVRSREWLRQEALEFIGQLGVGFCNIDQPRFRSNIPLTDHAFGSIGYLRLHGRNAEAWFAEDAGRDRRYDYLYGPQELDDIQTAIEKIADKVERMYVIANNHYRGQAPVNALQLMERLTGQDVPVPERLSKHYDI